MSPFLRSKKIGIFILKLGNSHKKEPRISDQELLSLAHKIVSRYVSLGSIPMRELEDTQMAIVEHFIIKSETIYSAFTGKSKLTTYIIAVLNRMCCEVIRKNLRHWHHTSDEALLMMEGSETSASEKLLIRDEMNLLERILSLYTNEKSKIRVFMAYYLQLPVNSKDVKQYSPHNFQKLAAILTQSADNKGDTFYVLAQAVNLAESKEVKSDAVRMWLNKTTDCIINRLNGPFNRTNYDKESFQVLFEYYYMEKNEE